MALYHLGLIYSPSSLASLARLSSSSSPPSFSSPASLASLARLTRKAKNPILSASLPALLSFCLQPPTRVSAFQFLRAGWCDSQDGQLSSAP